MSAAAIRVAPVSADLLIKIGLAAAGLVAAWWLFSKAKAAIGETVSGLADLPGSLFDQVREYGAGIADDVASAVDTVTAPIVNTAANMAAAAPGAGLPAGWYTVKTWQGNIVTQYPDRYKSLNRWDSVLVDP